MLIIAHGKLVADDTPEELAARAGKPRFIATVQRNGESAAARDAISAIETVHSVTEREGVVPNELVIEVLPKGTEDLRADIFRAAVGANLVLLGLEQKGENLEDVFRQLTTGDGGSAS